MLENFTGIFLGFSLACAVLSSVAPLCCWKNFNGIKLTHTILLGFSGVSALIYSIVTLVTHTSYQFSLPNNLFHCSWSIYLDSLSAFFIAIISLITCCVVFYIPSYLRKHEQSRQSLLQLTFFGGLFILGMYLVVLANDVITFIASWELMSLTSYFLVTYQHNNTENRNAGFVYLIMAHLSGLFILLGFGVITKFSHDPSFLSFQATTLPTNWAVISFVLAFIGFGIKAGLVPLHVWLPKAHPVAPSHISALMSGVMLKVAIYGFIRFVFCLLHQIYWQEGLVVLLFGSLSAVFGVLCALTQNNLKRLLAYSSIENIGIIFIGLGLSMIFFSAQQKVAALIALIAALYHCLNHAVFKSLLFLGAGAISQRTHEHDLERMGGLIHRMPYTAITFLIGCLSISALPLFNGFVSEWLTLQSALQAMLLQDGIMRTLIIITAATIALTGALAAACFVKVFGIAFLGKPRSRHARRANCTKIDMQIAMGVLASFCILFGLFPNFVFDILGKISSKLIGIAIPNNLFTNWLWLVPTAPHNASYSALAILLLVVGTLFATYIFGYLLKPIKPAVVVRPWDCGFGALNSRTQYTSTAFAMPLRRVFGGLWNITEEITQENSAKTFYKLTLADRIWQSFYARLGKFMSATTKYLAKIQSGSIRAYLAYMFFTLLFLLWVIA